MKKIILLFLIIISQLGYSKEISETEKQASLCKVWGFLKYYHPTVAKGDYNWDEQLMLVLPKIENAKTKEAISKVYLDWIDSLGEIKECKSCKEENTKEYFDKNFNLAWTQKDELFSDKLSEKLKHIENNRFQGKNHYVSATKNGNISVKNEPQYENFEYPNENYRLLSLFKLWNTIEYFYPYKYLTDQNWDDVLSEMIPKFKNAKSATEYHLAMLEIVVKMDDSHGIFKTHFTANYFGTKFIPAKLKIIDNRAIVTGFLNDSLSIKNDLKVGDIIEKIEGKTVNEIIETKLKYINSSNYNGKFRDTYLTITSGNTDSLEVVLNRENSIKNRIIKRYPFEKVFNNSPKLEKYNLLDNNVGYVNMAILKRNDVDEMMKKMSNTEAIIFDIRNYPNFIPYQISNFINSEKREFLKTTIPDLSYPGKFIWQKNSTTGKKNSDYYKGKVIVLVDEKTQSRAEYSVMCLQTGNNVTTVGSQTAGADGNVSRIEFIGGYTSLISGTGIYYPDGSQTQRIGLKVDIEVKLTIKGIQEGKDEVLEKAIEVIRSEK